MPKDPNRKLNIRIMTQLTKSGLAALDRQVQVEGSTRAAVVRRALDAYNADQLDKRIRRTVGAP